MVRVTVSAFGEMRDCGDQNKNKSFDWGNALIDAAIIAGLTFFSTLAGAKTANLPNIQTIYIAGVSAAVQFFSILAIKRGLIKQGS